MEHLINWIKSRPALSAKKIAELSGFHHTTLSNSLSATDRPFPEKHAWSLCVTLCDYGLDVGGYRWSYDEETNIFLIESIIPEMEIEAIDKGNHFEYLVPMYRDLIGEEYELINFLNNIK